MIEIRSTYSGEYDSMKHLYNLYKSFNDKSYCSIIDSELREPTDDSGYWEFYIWYIAKNKDSINKIDCEVYVYLNEKSKPNVI